MGRRGTAQVVSIALTSQEIAISDEGMLLKKIAYIAIFAFTISYIGTTPWNTFVSCEEYGKGQCWQVSVEPVYLRSSFLIHLLRYTSYFVHNIHNVYIR